MHENKCNRVKSFFPLIKRINGNDKRICQFRIQLETSFELTLIKRGEKACSYSLDIKDLVKEGNILNWKRLIGVGVWSFLWSNNEKKNLLKVS